MTRSALASGRETLPSTLRAALASQARTRASRAAAELAVDVRLEARAGQEVLEDTDVTSAHPLMQGTLPEDLLGGAAAAETGMDTSPTAIRPTASIRQRDNENPFFHRLRG